MHLLGLALGEQGPQPIQASEVETQVAAWKAIARRWKSDLSAEEEAKELSRARTRGRKVDL